jgi:hypothetical protein
MIAYIFALFPPKNRISALLIKMKSCERDKENLSVFIEYQILRNCQDNGFSPQFLMQIGLDKLEGKSKGY